MAESLIQSWTACELMLNYLWELYLNSKKGPAGTYERMNRGRIKKLTGRDFSVSSVTELLELSGQLDFDLMKNLHEVRTNRNAWLHSLKEILLKFADYLSKMLLLSLSWSVILVFTPV